MNVPQQTAIYNRRWATALIEACVQLGIDHFFIAPGSRCTPLTLAVARNPQTVVVKHFDERGLAFCCLGYGRRQKAREGRPGVFICTSGTAVANAFPAVVESAMDHVPMLLFTADRPPELRGTGANQTIDQVNIFGRYPTYFRDVPCPESEKQLKSAQELVRTAAEHAARGPVHLNMMFREPFDDSYRSSDRSDSSRSLDESTTDPFAERDSRQATNRDGSDAELIHQHLQHDNIERPGGSTIVALGGCDPAQRDIVAEAFSDDEDTLLIGDITSGLRSDPYDLALISRRLPIPANVIHLGGRIVSKRWWQFVERNTFQHYWHVWPHQDVIDPTRTVSQRFVMSIEEFCGRIVNKSNRNNSSSLFCKNWTSMSAAAFAAARSLMDEIDVLVEPVIASQLAELIPHGSRLFLGNSLPVRAFDSYAFWEPDRAIEVFSNRGASGIDGLVATSVGAAMHGELTTAFIGDLSVLHDLNSLALVAKQAAPMILIVANNDGGGIFHYLPIAEESRYFEEYFATPHGWRLQNAAEQFGLPYARIRTIRDFRRAYREAVDAGVSCLLEVEVDRRANQRFHRLVTERIERLDVKQSNR